MRNKKALIFLGLLLTVSLAFFWVPSNKAQIKGARKETWVKENLVGFPVWIAANSASGSTTYPHRHIYIFVEAENFNEPNILKLFTSLGGEFEVPDDLTIDAYSDGAALQAEINAASEGCTIWSSSPEGRRRSRDYYIKTYPHHSGFYRARYSRGSDGKRANIEYSPNPSHEHFKTIYQINPAFNSSDPVEDFVISAKHGDVAVITHRLSQDSSKALLKTGGDKALRAAASNGQSEMVDTLLNAGVLAKSEAGNNALLAAAIDGNAEIAQTLLDRGADANALTGRIDKGFEDNLGDGLNDSVLMMAAQHGHPDVVRTLLAKGARIDERNQFHETALMQAAIAGFPQVIRLLASNGADVNARDVNGQTALMLAQDDRETVDTLLDLGADYKAIDKKGETALMLAIKLEPAKREALVSRGAGKESIEATKRYISAPPAVEGMPQEYVKADGYQVLADIYLKLEMKREAVDAGNQMLEVLGDRPYLRGRLAFLYVAAGDKESALAQYKILNERANQATDKETRWEYEWLAERLWSELNK